MAASAVRLFRWGESSTIYGAGKTRATFSCYFWFPVRFDIPGTFWNVFQFKSKEINNSTNPPTTLRNDPFWTLNVGNRGAGAGGAFYFYLYDWQNRITYQQNLVNIPIADWVQVSAYLVQSANGRGRLQIKQDDRILWDLTNIDTKYPNVPPNREADNQWSINSYSDDLGGVPRDLFVAKARIEAPSVDTKEKRFYHIRDNITDNWVDGDIRFHFMRDAWVEGNRSLAAGAAPHDYTHDPQIVNTGKIPGLRLQLLDATGVANPVGDKLTGYAQTGRIRARNNDWGFWTDAQGNHHPFADAYTGWALGDTGPDGRIPFDPDPFDPTRWPDGAGGWPLPDQNGRNSFGGRPTTTYTVPDDVAPTDGSLQIVAVAAAPAAAHTTWTAPAALTRIVDVYAAAGTYGDGTLGDTPALTVFVRRVDAGVVPGVTLTGSRVAEHDVMSAIIAAAGGTVAVVVDGTQAVETNVARAGTVDVFTTGIVQGSQAVETNTAFAGSTAITVNPVIVGGTAEEDNVAFAGTVIVVDDGAVDGSTAVEANVARRGSVIVFELFDVLGTMAVETNTAYRGTVIRNVTGIVDGATAVETNIAYRGSVLVHTDDDDEVSDGATAYETNVAYAGETIITGEDVDMPFLAGRLDLVTDARARYTARFTFLLSDRVTPFDLTGYRVQLQARDDTPDQTVALDVSTDDQLTVVDAAAGIVKLDVPASMLPATGIYVYDMVLIPGGDPDSAFYAFGGILRVRERITREVIT